MGNVLEPDWQFESDQPPFLGRVASVGAQAGAERLGASLYEIAPGGQVSPLHVHHANEELIVVLSDSRHFERRMDRGSSMSTRSCRARSGEAGPTASRTRANPLSASWS